MSSKEEDVKVTAVVPQYVLDYAPILHLSQKDPYHPTPLSTFLANTEPQISFKPITIPSPPLTLSNLDQLNSVGTNNGTDIDLTSKTDVTKNPAWIKGITPDANGGPGDDNKDGKTAVVVVVDKGAGIVDAFYFYFWAWNFGGVVLGQELGDHVGDWEHNMIRFENGVPKAVWYSSHANGAAYKFDILHKHKSGKRPLVYAANGSHALYPTPGTHDHTIPNHPLPFRLLLVDETDAGPLYDPLLSAYYYTYTPSTSTFTPLQTPISGTNGPIPTSYLHFAGRWGDAEYPPTDPRQRNLASFKKFVGGPTGPLDKQLDRKEVWPANSWSSGQRVRGSLGGGFGEWVRGLGSAVRRGWERLRGREGRVVRVGVDGGRV